MRDRNLRQGFLGEKLEEILSETRVAIIGNCGGGSHVAQQLAHVGFCRFVLVDPDVTEEPNLNRMIGSLPEDAYAARQKTEVLDRFIRAINPRAVVECLNSKWQEVAINLRTADVVFGCVDGYVTRNELEAWCRRFLVPYIDVGMDVATFEEGHLVSGQVITSLPGRACMWCLGFLNQKLLGQEAGLYGTAGPRPQVVWPNGVLASIAVGNAMKILTPWTAEPVCPYLVYDGNRQTVTPSSRLAHVDLHACRHYPQEHVGDPFWGKLINGP